jgi:hypothetical protein
MWPFLCLVAVAPPPPPPQAPLAAGTHVRLTAPRARSGEGGRPRYAVPVRREGALLVFTYADGSTSASLLPGTSVTGAFEGADASWVHLRRAPNTPPIRLHRGSVARVEVSGGYRYPVGRRMAKGLGVGLLVGAGVVGGAYATSGGCSGECEGGGLAIVFVGLAGAAGLVLGTMAGAVGQTTWREVPLDALGTLPTPADSGTEAPVRGDAAEPAVDSHSGSGPGRRPRSCPRPGSGFDAPQEPWNLPR